MRQCRGILFLLLLFQGAQVFGQVRMDKKLLFNAVSAANRTIQGIVLAYDSTSGLPHSAFIENKLNFIAAPSGSPVLTISLPTQVTALIPGMELFIRSAVPNPGAIFLNVNGLGAVEVKKRGNSSLLASELAAGQIYRVIYDGTFFMLQSPTDLECPAGFASVNDSYCMEINERTGASYLTAVNTCYSMNARLCTWGEFYYACQNAGTLGILNANNNFEFADDTSDHSNTVLLVASGTCNTTTTATPTLASAIHPYRCCYSK